jgi:hypothetical protein
VQYLISGEEGVLRLLLKRVMTPGLLLSKACVDLGPISGTVEGQYYNALKHVGACPRTTSAILMRDS